MKHIGALKIIGNIKDLDSQLGLLKRFIGRHRANLLRKLLPPKVTITFEVTLK